MPVKKDPSGRRYVEATAEIPGTPEEVWQAIATGPGVSSWFVPTEVQYGEGGAPIKMILHFGPGSSMDSVATVTAWDPPRRFSAESPGEGPNAPTIATEWIVEGRDGGTCTVRVVHRWFSDSDAWDNQFEGTEHGWVAFFRILRLYRHHFAPQPSAMFQLMPMTSQSTSEAWETLTGSLGITDPREGERVQSVAGTPQLAGVIKRVGPAEHPELLLQLTDPAPGIAHFFVMAMGGTVCVPIRCFFYGGEAKAVASRAEPLWQAWANERFPVTNGVSGVV